MFSIRVTKKVSNQ